MYRINEKHRDVASIFILSTIIFSLTFTVYTSTLNLLVLFSLLVWLFFPKSAIEMDVRLFQWMTVVLAIFFLLGLLPIFFHDAPSRPTELLFHHKSAALIAVLLFMFILVRLAPSENVIWWALLIGAQGVFIAVLLELYFKGWDHLFSGHRLGTMYGTGILKFGVFSNLLFGILLGAFFWVIRQKYKWWLLLFLLFTLTSVFLGSILSGTRGAWLGLPEIIIGWGIFYYVYYFRKQSSGRKVVILILLTLFVVATLWLGKNKIENRVNNAVKNVEKYFDGNPNTSIGLRLVMYEAAWDGIKENVFTGVGQDNIQKELRERMLMIYESKFINHVEAAKGRGELNSWDVHNQYLQEFFSRGILGLLSLILVQLFLLLFFIRRVRECGINIWAVTGIIFVLASAINLMSYSWMRFNTGMFFYFVLTTLMVYASVAYKASKD